MTRNPRNETLVEQEPRSWACDLQVASHNTAPQMRQQPQPPDLTSLSPEAGIQTGE